jgi:predicted cation transporter
LLLAPVGRNLEVYCLALGIIGVTAGAQWAWELVARAAATPLMITAAVFTAGLLFEYAREPLDRAFARMRAVAPRPLLTAITIFVIAMISSLITAIVAALVLVEAIGLLEVAGETRTRVAVAGCFAIGLGAALTPIGEPLATLVASALQLGFFGLFRMLAPWVLPGIAAVSALAGFFARGEYDLAAPEIHARESKWELLIESAKVYAFIAALVLISEAYAPLAARYLPRFGDDALFWANTISAALDNATLVALEVHHMTARRVIDVLLSLLISGGMLIPGNIPNIVSAGVLRITSAEWARVGLPLGLVMLGIYFAVLRFAL